MKRFEFWMIGITLFAVIAALGYIGAATHASDGYFLTIRGIGLIGFWVLGAARMDDTKYSQAWAFFTPFILGMIVIGCLPSKPEPEPELT